MADTSPREAGLFLAVAAMRQGERAVVYVQVCVCVLGVGVFSGG